MKRFIVGLASLAAVGAMAAPVQADPIIPIVVTSGSWVFPANTLTFAGDGFSLTGHFPDFTSIGDTTCDPCSSALNQPIGGLSDMIPFEGNGSPGTFNGVSYPAAYIDGGMQFTVPPLFAGALSPDHTTLTAPFSMTGSLAGFTTAAELQANELLSETTGAFVNDPPGTVTGSGTVTVQFALNPFISSPGSPAGTLFEPRSIVYQFQSSPPLTPEPTTLLLFGTGVFGLIWRRVRA